MIELLGLWGLLFLFYKVSRMRGLFTKEQSGDYFIINYCHQGSPQDLLHPHLCLAHPFPSLWQVLTSPFFLRSFFNIPFKCHHIHEDALIHLGELIIPIPFWPLPCASLENVFYFSSQGFMHMTLLLTPMNSWPQPRALRRQDMWCLPSFPNNSIKFRKMSK